MDARQEVVQLRQPLIVESAAVRDPYDEADGVECLLCLRVFGDVVQVVLECLLVAHGLVKERSLVLEEGCDVLYVFFQVTEVVLFFDDEVDEGGVVLGV